MIRVFISSLVLSMVGSTGCVSTERLNTRIDLLQKEVTDLQRAHRRVERRIDELQIQLSLLSRKLEHPATGPGDKSHRVPTLKVVKLHPEEKSYQLDRPRKKRARTELGGSVDPDRVSERLPVDRDAARRPLMGSEDVGEDEETISRKFRQACSFFNTAEYAMAVSALNHFIESHSEHPLAIDAMHLVGEAKLAQGRITEAQRTFTDLTERHPNSERAISALLMVGKCEEKLGHVKQARSTYLQLVEAHPLSREAAEANRRLQAMR